MNFVERIFGIAPDGGDGSLELLLFVVPLTLVLVIMGWRRRQAGTRRED
jgi:hypothetical protein